MKEEVEISGYDLSKLILEINSSGERVSLYARNDGINFFLSGINQQKVDSLLKKRKESEDRRWRVRNTDPYGMFN